MLTEINTVNNDYWGDLVCFGDENGSPCFWGKKKLIKCLTPEATEVIIGMNLYVYNKNFETEYKEERVKIVNDEIKEAYEAFLSDLDSIDEIFLREYNDEDNQEEWELEISIKGKDDIYNSVKLIRVEILKKHYHLVFELDGNEWVLDKNLKYSGFTLMPSQNAPYPEMEYT